MSRLFLFSKTDSVLARWRDTRRQTVLKRKTSAFPGDRHPDPIMRRIDVGLMPLPPRKPNANDRHLAKLKITKLYHYIQNLHALGGVVQVTGDDSCNRWLFKALYQMLRESSDSTFWLRVFWQVIDGAQFRGPRRMLIMNAIPYKFVDENAQYDLLILMQNDIEVRLLSHPLHIRSHRRLSMAKPFSDACPLLPLRHIDSSSFFI